MYECPNCGGNLWYDIPSGKIACRSCDSKFDPYEVSEKNGAEEGTDYEVTVFTCPQCGGEIYSTDNTAAGFCTFCGSSAILESRLQREHRPGYIIPFQKTKDECKKSYIKMMRHAIFAPKELKSEKHISEFRGIYMPYWVYDIRQGGDNVSLQGATSRRVGDYIVTSHYLLDLDLQAYYKGISFDASSSFADAISEKLAPFDVKNMKRFTPSFLSGFYADTSDVDTSLYEEDARKLAVSRTKDFLEKDKTVKKYKLEGADATIGKQLNTCVKSVDGAMFPVWFMAYKNKDRVAYATVNGQTGKVVADLPVDHKKYVVGSLILALPLFLLLNMFLTVTPDVLLSVVSMIAMAVTLLYGSQMKAIAVKEGKEDDKGAFVAKRRKQRRKLRPAPGQSVEKVSDSTLAATAEEKKKGKEWLKLLKDNDNLLSLVKIVIILWMFCGVPIIAGRFGYINIKKIFITVSLVVTAISHFAGTSRIKEIEAKRGVAGSLWIFIATVIAALIVYINPVSDFFYYGCVIIVLLGVLAAFMDLIGCYNIYATRPLPQFHYQGGDNRA